MNHTVRFTNNLQEDLQAIFPDEFVAISHLVFSHGDNDQSSSYNVTAGNLQVRVNSIEEVVNFIEDQRMKQMGVVYGSRN